MLISTYGFEGVYVGAAALAASALAIVVLARMRIAPSDPDGRPRVTLAAVRSAAPAVLALSAFRTAMFMGSNAMSIVVAQDLGSERDVVLLFSLCAGLEVFVMGAFVVWPALSGKRWFLVAGFLLSGLATGVWANAFGYWSLFSLCAVLCVLAMFVLIVFQRMLDRQSVADR